MRCMRVWMRMSGKRKKEKKKKKKTYLRDCQGYAGKGTGEMTLRPTNKRTVDEEFSTQVTYGHWWGEFGIGLDRLRAKTQRELE